MTKEQKIIVHVELDPELLEKIDREAEKDLRTRKAQVLHILRERFNKSSGELKKNIFDNFRIRDRAQEIKELFDEEKN